MWNWIYKNLVFIVDGLKEFSKTGKKMAFGWILTLVILTKAFNGSLNIVTVDIFCSCCMYFVLNHVEFFHQVISLWCPKWTLQIHATLTLRRRAHWITTIWAVYTTIWSVYKPKSIHILHVFHKLIFKKIYNFKVELIQLEWIMFMFMTWKFEFKVCHGIESVWWMNESQQ